MSLLISSGCITPNTGEPAGALMAQYPAPGDLIDVNGSLMHIRCTGNGSPVVLLEAGSTDCSLSWALVQPDVSQFTRVCSYDRAGYGWSEPVAGPVSATDVNMRLHTLLERANISPPYILVGHSLGGEYVRAYAHRYPDDVYGIVLVDPGSEWQMARTGKNFTLQQEREIAESVAAIRKQKDLAENGTFTRNLTLVPVDPRLPAHEFLEYRALLAARPTFWEARAVEAESAFSIFYELQQENITSLGSVPLLVISSGNEMRFSSDPQENAHANKVFRTLQREMAQESSQGEYLVAQNTSHYVQLDRPDIVINAIFSIVNKSRSGS